IVVEHFSISRTKISTPKTFGPPPPRTWAYVLQVRACRCNSVKKRTLHSVRVGVVDGAGDLRPGKIALRRSRTPDGLVQRTPRRSCLLGLNGCIRVQPARP